MQAASRQRRRHLSGRRLCAALSVAAVAAATVGPLPATATIGPEGVPPGRNITVFHNIDFVAVFGWPLGVPITVSVIRNNVTIGSARGPSVMTPEGPGLEVNHGPEGAPVAGDCWIGQTPDIKPDDTILVTNGTARSSVIVDDITFSGPATEDPVTHDVLVRGVAQFANGEPIPIARLDSAEFRDTSKFRGVPDVVEADPGSPVPGAFIMRYHPPYNLERNTNLLTEAQRKASLLNSGGHAIGFGHVAPLPREAMLVDGIADTPGPALGCDGFVQPPVDTATRPARPPSIRATAGNHSAGVSWTRPASGGNATITGYRLRVFRGANVARRINLDNVNRTTVRRLVNGVGYRFDVRAVNRVGTSVASPRSNVVVPRQ